MLFSVLINGCNIVAYYVALPPDSVFVCLASVLIRLATNELKKYTLVCWLPTLSNVDRNVWRALAGSGLQASH